VNCCSFAGKVELCEYEDGVYEIWPDNRTQRSMMAFSKNENAGNADLISDKKETFIAVCNQL
jgi:hypothetical protein